MSTTSRTSSCRWRRVRVPSSRTTRCVDILQEPVCCGVEETKAPMDSTYIEVSEVQVLVRWSQCHQCENIYSRDSKDFLVLCALSFFLILRTCTGDLVFLRFTPWQSVTTGSDVVRIDSMLSSVQFFFLQQFIERFQNQERLLDVYLKTFNEDQHDSIFHSSFEKIQWRSTRFYVLFDRRNTNFSETSRVSIMPEVWESEEVKYITFSLSH